MEPKEKRLEILEKALHDFKQERKRAKSMGTPLNSSYWGLCLYLHEMGHLPPVDAERMAGNSLKQLVEYFPELGIAYTILTENEDPIYPKHDPFDGVGFCGFHAPLQTGPGESPSYWFKTSDIKSRIRVLEKACELLRGEIEVERAYQEKERRAKLKGENQKKTEQQILLMTRLLAKMIRCSDLGIPFHFELEIRPVYLDNDPFQTLSDLPKACHQIYTITLDIPNIPEKK
jgi:hypothetical protein